MFSPDMQVRVYSSDNLGNKRGWSCERWGGVKNVVKEEEKEEEGGGRKREKGRQEQEGRQREGGKEEKDEGSIGGSSHFFPFESERSGPHADPGGLDGGWGGNSKTRQHISQSQPVLIIPNR